MAWNERSRKYLRRGDLDGRSVQMLVDSGCSQTMVSARLVDAAKISSQEKVPILCAHGDTVLYRKQERRKEQGREDKELRGKEDDDETETEASLVQGKSSSVETLDGGQVEGQPECEWSREPWSASRESDEEDGVTEKGEVVTQDGGANAK